jgi:hypothetical protein
MKIILYGEQIKITFRKSLVEITVSYCTEVRKICIMVNIFITAVRINARNFE